MVNRPTTLASAARARLRGLMRRVRGVQRFRGAFATHAEAMAAVRPGALAGYDHDEMAEVAFDHMCDVQLWDYPVLFWLDRLIPERNALLDAGGHMGTKFRAFRDVLRLPPGFDWAVYDLPAIVRAGRARAEREGLQGLSFHDQLEATPPSDLLLASGLLQFIDIPFTDLLQRLPHLPTHLVLNKVATRDGPSVVTLEQLPKGEVPYQVRNHGEFLSSLEALGYKVADAWEIPALSHAHSTFGRSTSRGFCLSREKFPARGKRRLDLVNVAAMNALNNGDNAMARASEASGSPVLGEAWRGRIFSADKGVFRRDFGIRSFALEQNLHTTSLFEPKRLALAAERALAGGYGDRFAVAGNEAAIASGFASMGERARRVEAVADLGAANSWMKLSSINLYDSDYADLLRDGLADLRELSADPVLDHISFAHMTVFMASPNVVTPYHIDHESNVLSQVAGGKKVVCVFPPDDRELLLQEEIEAFYVSDLSSAKYKPNLQGRGVEYAMHPGMAIHHPPLAPHWVKNGDDVSISVSINFCMPPLERRARVHQMNYHLRKLGMHPPEPNSGFRDDLKSGFLSLLSKRNPNTYQEVVFSGVRRMRKPFVLAARLAKGAAGR
jgi:putative methyltransferase (TIGR04325 family)